MDREFLILKTRNGNSESGRNELRGLRTIGNKAGRFAIAVGGTVGSFIMCPGDDILMITGALVSQDRVVIQNEAVLPSELKIKEPEMVDVEG